MSVVKYNRVARMSRWSSYPRTYAAIVAQIPDALWSALTSRQIVDVIEVMQSAHGAGRACEARDAVDQGLAWDERRQQHREVV